MPMSEGCYINKQLFRGRLPPLVEIPVGAVHQWSLSGIDDHPFHLHSTPFQLMWTSHVYPWAMPGDWYDTLLVPHGGGAVVRF